MNLRTWETVKNRVHDVNGIDKPENWLYESKDGIFYPVEELGNDEEIIDQMFEELDPDWSVEELENHGWVVKEDITGYFGKNTDEVDIRDGCGNFVND